MQACRGHKGALAFVIGHRVFESLPLRQIK
jgi:hypothetical protein